MTLRSKTKERKQNASSLYESKKDFCGFSTITEINLMCKIKIFRLTAKL